MLNDESIGSHLLVVLVTSNPEISHRFEHIPKKDVKGTSSERDWTLTGLAMQNRCLALFQQPYLARSC